MTILVISEKPSAGRKIAEALSGGKARAVGRGKVKHFEFVKDGEEVLVAASVGHVYGLRQKGDGSDYPIFEIEWAPIYEIEETADYARDYLYALSKLCAEADEIVNACDYDTEGGLIGFNIIRFNAARKKHSRMKFSTLTAKELKEAFQQRGPLDLPQAYAGEARHQLDWLWGINSSRALMHSIRRAGFFKILSIGRVQGPALTFLAQREREIAAFRSKPFWQLFALIQGVSFEHVHGKFWHEAEADQALARSSKKGLVKNVTSKKVKQRPPPPFDLTSLQLEAYRCFGFPPTRTLQLAQELYEAGVCSYPRTSSQKLPARLGLAGIIEQLVLQPSYQKLAQQLVNENRFVPAEGQKEDPAHPALHPTGEVPQDLGVQQQKLYDLIVKRFLACFAKETKKIRMSVVLQLGEEDYAAEGVHTVEEGWIAFYAPYANPEEVALPQLREGEPVEAEKIEKLRKETQPPKRYTQASIIKALDARGLGTKATRAQIIQTLYDRQYVEGQSIKVTPLGLAVEKSLEHNAPEILSEELTRRFENEMEEIEQEKIKKEQVVEDGKKALLKILNELKQKEDVVGRELAEALKQTQRQQNVLGACKNCGKNLVIRKSAYGLFVGCLGYPECKTTYPLPKEASIKPLGKACEQCGTPLVSVHRKGKRSFQMCLEPQCKTKESWAKKPEPTQKPAATAL